MTLREDWMHVSKNTVIPAQAGTHLSVFETVARWVPAFPADQVRGLKAHGKTAWVVGCLAAALVLALPASAAETPKRGGTLTFMIPADAPPSFDAHREGTFAMLHATAPFYSVLIRVNPENPSSTTDFVCDVCTEMPKPTNEGRTYT